jgi:hypothetical protein
MKMRTTWTVGVLAATAFLYAAPPSVAQDEGKAAAAELTSESKAALQQLYTTQELAKMLGTKAQAILVFPAKAHC